MKKHTKITNYLKHSYSQIFWLKKINKNKYHLPTFKVEQIYLKTEHSKLQVFPLFQRDTTPAEKNLLPSNIEERMLLKCNSLINHAFWCIFDHFSNAVTTVRKLQNCFLEALIQYAKPKQIVFRNILHPVFLFFFFFFFSCMKMAELSE